VGGLVVDLADGGGQADGIELGERLEDLLVLVTAAGLHLRLGQRVVAEDGPLDVVVPDGGGEPVLEGDEVLVVRHDGALPETHEVPLDYGGPRGQFVVGAVVFVGGGVVEVASLEFAEVFVHNRKYLETNYKFILNNSISMGIVIAASIGTLIFRFL
jgi:hypothetical protein